MFVCGSLPPSCGAYRGVTHKGFENPLQLNLSNPVESDKSAEHEICSSVHNRFRCAYIANVGRFAPTLSDQTNAAISRRYDCDRRRFASRHAQEGARQPAKVGAKKLWNTGVSPVRWGRLVYGYSCRMQFRSQHRSSFCVRFTDSAAIKELTICNPKIWFSQSAAYRMDLQLDRWRQDSNPRIDSSPGIYPNFVGK